MATTEKELGRQTVQPLAASPAAERPAAEDAEFEADYAEDRPVALLAERQREFQRKMQGQFVEAEMLVDSPMPAPETVVTPEARAAFLRHLLAQGVIPSIPEGRLGPPPRPIPVRGEPVSQTIVEDRGS